MMSAPSSPPTGNRNAKLHRNSPYLSHAEFASACRDLQNAAKENDGTNDLQLSLETRAAGSWLSIRRAIEVGPRSAADQVAYEDEHFDYAIDQVPDPAEAPTIEPITPTKIDVDYSIVLSPTYHVPVLYVQIPSMPSTSAMLDAARQQLMPPSLKPQVAITGIMGAVSPTNHPISDSPCLFIHPCRTADAMQAALPDREVTAVEYLVAWVGLIGPSVGLYLPKETALHATSLTSS